MTPRKPLDEGVEEVVAGECLASLASVVEAHSSASQVRAAARPASRLASVPPPLPIPEEALTTPHLPLPPGLPGHRAPSAPAFVRRTSVDRSPAAVVTAPAVTASSSVAPVSAAARVEPTIIVVRERPRAAWILGAAALGAVCAMLSSRLVSSSAAQPEAAVAAPALSASPLLPVPSAVLVASGSVAPVIAPAVAPSAPVSGVVLPPFVPPAVVSFGADQGVAIAKPTPAPAPRPAAAAPRPVAAAKTASSTLPDGSLALGASASAPAPVRAAPAAAAPPVEAPHKHAMTPEQQLADAQLKASMR